MQEQLEHYDSLGISASEYYKINKASKIKKTVKSGCKPDYIVLGYQPYWSNGLEKNYQWNLLTDFVYFSYEVNPNTGSPNTTHSWLSAASVTTAQNNGLRIHLCATLFSNHSTFLNSNSAKNNFISKIIYYLKQRNANGVNIDFEGVSSSLKDSLNSFLVQLAKRVHSAIPNSIVSVALPAVDWNSEYNISLLKNYLDWFIIMGYDYYWNGSSTAGPNSPMFKFQSSYDYDLSKSITFYLKQGLNPNKLVLAIPYYGREWSTSQPSVPSSTKSSGYTRTYSYVKNHPNTYITKEWESKSFSPYYVYYDSNNSTWKQCFIDDAKSLDYKYKYLVRYRNLAGIGIWALGYDDGYSQLWQTIANELTNCRIIPCSDTIFDIGGGPAWNYYPKEDYQFTIAPDKAQQIKLFFSNFDLESGYDSLWIYDGYNSKGNILAKLSGNTIPDTIFSHSNAITIKFHSDGATQKSGFYAIYKCTSTYTPPCILLSENFDNGLPKNWKNIVLKNGNHTYIWQFNNPGNRSIADSVIKGKFAIFDDDNYGDNGQKSNAALETDTLNCSYYSKIYLSFGHFFRHSVNNPADAYLEISNNGGQSWTTLDHWKNSDNGPSHLHYDISQYAAHKSKVLIRWHYEDNANWSNYWAIDDVQIKVNLEGIKTIKPNGTGDFYSFKQAIDALKFCGVCGKLKILVEPNHIYNETLSPITFSGSADKTITFQSADTSLANPIIETKGSPADSDAIIKFVGADYFNFKNIDFKAKDSTVEYGILITNKSPDNGATHNTFQNCNITLFNSDTSSVGLKQYLSYVPDTTKGTNSDNKFIKLNIKNAYFGMQLYGKDSFDNLRDDSCLISNCKITNFGLGGTDKRAVGIHFWGQKNLTINNCTVQNGYSTSRTLGIYAAGHNSNILIQNNTVHNLYGESIQVVGLRSYVSSVTFRNNIIYNITGKIMACGIESYAGHDTIYNNFISKISAPDANAIANGFPAARGISLRETNAFVFFNTVFLNDTSTNANNQNTAFYVQNSYTTAKNNIFINNSNFVNGSVAPSVYFKYTDDFNSKYAQNSSNNDFYTIKTPSTKNPIAYIDQSKTKYLSLQDFKNAVSPAENNSISDFPQFINIKSVPYDLHINPNTYPSIENAGVPIYSPLRITTDFDSENRNSEKPDIGADEFFHYIKWTGKNSNNWYQKANWCPSIIPDTNYNTKIAFAHNLPIISDTTAFTKNIFIDSLCNIQINANAELFIADSAYLNNDSSKIIITNNSLGFGSVISNKTVLGTIKLKLFGSQWHYISSPIQNCYASVFRNPLYAYNENTPDYWNYGNTYGQSGWYKINSSELVATNGYAYYSAPQTILIKGKFNSKNYTISQLSFTHYNNIDDKFAGWHLIGNPYPAYIDWYKATKNGDIILSNIDNTIYFYNGATQNYEYYNGNINQGNAGFNGALNLATPFIAPAQAFFVHANSPNAQIIIKKSARTKANTPFYKKNLLKNYPFICLSASNKFHQTDQTAIVTLPEAGNNFDPKYDAYKIFTKNPSLPQIFTQSDSIFYAINSIPQIKDTIFSLGFFAIDSGKYSISLDKFSLDSDIYLIDPENQKQINLKKSDYQFNHQGGYRQFYLKIGKILNKKKILSKTPIKLSIYPNPSRNYLYINGLNDYKKIKISILDMLGRRVCLKISSDKITKINISNLPKGLYIIKLNINNEILSFKFIKN